MSTLFDYDRSFGVRFHPQDQPQIRLNDYPVSGLAVSIGNFAKADSPHTTQLRTLWVLRLDAKGLSKDLQGSVPVFSLAKVIAS